VTSDVIAELAQEILAYVRAHPRARDTTAGILQWWLPPGRAALSASVLQEALDRLVAGGSLRAEKVPGGTVVYGGVDADRGSK
jgi:hypothetical protein